MITWIKNAWTKFESWVYKIVPGFKTYICVGLSFIGSTATVAKDYITQLPLDKFATATQIAVGTMVVSLLALWFHNMGERVEAAE